MSIYAQYMCNIYSVLLPLLSVLHTHTHEHVLRKKKIPPSGVVQLERQTNTRDPVRSIMILTSHSHVGRGPNSGDGATEKAKWTFFKFGFTFCRSVWLSFSLLTRLLPPVFAEFLLPLFFQQRRLQLFRVYYYFVVQYEWHASLGRPRLRWVFPPPQKQTIVTSGQELWLEPFLLFLNTPPLPSHFHRTQCDCAEHTLIISQTFRHLRQLPDFFNSHTSLKARGGLSY